MNIRDFLSEDAPLQKFFQGYLEAMCFTDLPDELMHSGEFTLDEEWGDKFSEHLLLKSIATCSTFLLKAYGLIPEKRMEEAGRDFWFTRQGDGVGFWESEWDSDHGNELTDLSEEFEQTGMYIDDDGLLYLE
jgi:hypothetical protein